MPNKELKPCPFCGGEAYVGQDECWYWDWEAHCLQCGATFDTLFETKKQAIEAWNRRADNER